MPISNRLFIITGTSRGIGSALAEKIMRRGDLLIALDRSPIERAGVVTVSFDMAQPEVSLENLESVVSELNLPSGMGVTLILNAAELGPTEMMGKKNYAAILKSINVNVVANMLLTDWLIRTFSHQATTTIFISSGAAKRAAPGLAIYGSGKAALESFIKTMNAEARIRGKENRFFIAQPGVVDTEMQKLLRDSDPETFPLQQQFLDLKQAGQLASASVVADRLIKIVDSDFASVSEEFDVYKS